MTTTTVTAEQLRVLVGLLAVAVAVALLARRLRVPYTLALVLVGLALGFLHVLPSVALAPNVVLFIFLPALLFEGALTIDARMLLANWLVVFLLAVPGLVLALLVVGAVLHWGAGMPWLIAALVGTIISPTDPVAVVALLRQLGMPARLRTIVEGESLFNDGVGAAAFTIVLMLMLASEGSAPSWTPPSALGVALRAVWLLVGGLVIGVGVGYAVALLLRHIDDRLIEIAITFGVAYGVYLIGDALGTSGLLATVCAGIVVGSFGRRVSFTVATEGALDTVWEFIGYLANSLLFLLLGLQIGATSLVSASVDIAWAVVGVVAGRALMIFVFLGAFDAFARWLAQRHPAHEKQNALVPTPLPRSWRPLILLSGLRGALSLALALSLTQPAGQVIRIQQIVFGVVLITLLGQGIGMRVLLPRWPKTT